MNELDTDPTSLFGFMMSCDALCMVDLRMFHHLVEGVVDALASHHRFLLDTAVKHVLVFAIVVFSSSIS